MTARCSDHKWNSHNKDYAQRDNNAASKAQGQNTSGSFRGPLQVLWWEMGNEVEKGNSGKPPKQGRLSASMSFLGSGSASATITTTIATHFGRSAGWAQRGLKTRFDGLKSLVIESTGRSGNTLDWAKQSQNINSLGSGTYLFVNCFIRGSLAYWLFVSSLVLVCHFRLQVFQNMPCWFD